MRSDANYRLSDKYWSHPEESIIHKHPSNTSCDEYMHEHFTFPEQKDTTEEQGTTIPAGTLKVGDEISMRAAGMIVDLVEMQKDGLLKTWNDEEHDGPRL
jgi:hypothetical protein